MIIHFGLKITKHKYNFKMNREEYAIKNKKSSFSSDKIYSDDWCDKHYNKCMKNFDLNMVFYSSLKDGQFNREIGDFLSKNSEFKEVFDLKEHKNVCGYYILVLDMYKQIYIGTTKDIYKIGRASCRERV